jgi:Caspase domain
MTKRFRLRRLQSQQTLDAIGPLHGNSRCGMNKGLLFWLCLLVLSSSLTSAALPAARVALVIGNANYPDARTPLSNTIKDARTLADEFRRIDFDVDFKENLNKQNMQNAITAFTGKITNGTVALLYFSDSALMSGGISRGTCPG